MNNDSKLQIYKGIIQYLLESSNCTLKDIADLSSSSIKNLRSIFCDERIQLNFSSELQLIKLYQIFLEYNQNKKVVD